MSARASSRAPRDGVVKSGVVWVSVEVSWAQISFCTIGRKEGNLNMMEGMELPATNPTLETLHLRATSSLPKGMFDHRFG